MIIKRNHRIIFRYINNQATLLNVDKGTVYTLNDTGTFIWRLLWKPREIAEITEKIKKHYEVSPTEVGKDVESFVKGCLKNHLVEEVV